MANRRLLAASRLHFAVVLMLLLWLCPLANGGTKFRNVSPRQSTIYSTFDGHGASGGRFNKLAAVPGTNNLFFYAASEWGGLWKTVDGGKNWFPLLRHVPQAAWDVAVDPAHPWIVYATSMYDGRVNPRSGIQVSYDSGGTWIRPDTVTPPASLNCPWRDELSGFGISIEPGAPNKVYVGTNCGVAISDNSGATWSYVNPSTSNGPSEIWDVLAQAGGLVDACGLEGHFRSKNGGGIWDHHNLPYSAFTTGRCSLAVSPDEPDVIFIADDSNDTMAAYTHAVWESDDGGQSWNPLPKARSGDNKRLPFVKTNKRSDENGKKRFDLWYGEQDIWRSPCYTPANPTGAGLRCSPTSWNIAGPGPMLENGGAHGDAGDLAFSEALVDACPVIFSSDGGVYYRNPVSTCDDPTFLQPDVSPHALWLWGMAGFNDSLGRVNLYFGLQDDSMWATLDAHADPPAWTDRLPSDSFGVVADASRVVWFGNDDLSILYVHPPGMTGAPTLVSLPTGQLMRAFIFLPAIAQFGDKKYVIATRDDTWQTSVYLTQDITASPVAWTKLGTAPANTCGVKASVFPSQPGEPVFYVQAGANCNIAFADNQGDGLYRYVGTGSSGTWTKIDPTGGIGIFDVDPNNANRLYASNLDANGRHMVFSANGGASWTVDAALDALMTGNGAFKFSNARGPTNDYGFNARFIGYPQPSLVAFDPYDPNVIVAGGRDSGLFLSTNGGADWGLLSDPFEPSASRPHISRPWFAHFYHEPAGPTLIYIGTQGSGVWEVGVSPPTANAGGPYSTNEGADVQLAGSGSDPDGSPLSFAWDLDNNGSFETAGGNPTFTNVGQDGVFTVRLKATAGGVSTIATTTVTVNNVAPSVALSSDAPKNENASITLSGSATDPGWQEALTATVNWGDGSGTQAIGGTLEQNRPDASLTFSLTHTYGDNGSFTATVCGYDDDTSTCQTIALQVNNVAPTAVIDKSSAILINGVPTVVTHSGQSQPFSGNSTDPGSDDLKLTWKWGDGTADSVTDSLVNPPNPDPFPSPSIQPRNLTDTPAHTFNSACLYEVKFVVADDDSGTGQDAVKVVILGNALAVRSAGYWQTEFAKALGASGKAHNPAATLGCYLQIVGYMSLVFNEARDASTLATAWGVLNVTLNSGSAAQLLDRQLLAVWLNVANGAIALSQPLDTNGDGIADTTLVLALANAEAVRLNPLSTAAQLVVQKDLLERINQLGP